MGVFERDKSELIQFLMDRYHVRYRPSKMGWQKVRCINSTMHLHGDRNPSASLSIEHGWLKCHSCMYSGDGYYWLQELEGLNAKQVNELAELDPIVHIDESDVWI